MNVLASSVVAAVVGGAFVCLPCGSEVARETATAVSAAVQGTDTATVRLHISGMTCATCPVTARVALNKLVGVYSATVTLPDSLGVVRFDPRRVKPAEIAAHLTKMTGYRANVLPDSAKAQRGGAP